LAIDLVSPVDASALDNPVWSALSGPHRSLAGQHHDLMWYPPSIAPFVSVPSADVVPDLESAHALGLGPQGYFVGACPDSLPDTWRIAARSYILQLFPAGEIPEEGEDAGTVLGESDGAAMRALTRIAFPDFFRERTAELGLYLGIYDGERLIAMAGERMALPGLQEISGVCTHPDFAGRGHARRLTRALLPPPPARHSLPMTSGQIAGAAIDVYDTEPLPPQHPYRHLDRLLATPHIGYVSRGLYERFYRDTVANINAWLDARSAQ
jgi:hypothetical protein